MCRKCVAVCWKTATSCPAYFFDPRRRGLLRIVLSQLCDLRLGAQVLVFTVWPLASSELQTQLSYLAGKPHLFRTLPLPSQRLGRYQIILLGDRGTCV